jgi:hypothetical protein
MNEPFAFAIEEGDDSFVVFGDVGWASLIARYTRFPDERREHDGYPVLEPAKGETLASILPLLSHGLVDAEFLQARAASGEEKAE